MLNIVNIIREEPRISRVDVNLTEPESTKISFVEVIKQPFFSIDDLPLDRTARRMMLTEQLTNWLTCGSPMGYVTNSERAFVNYYALYQSICNIVKRENLPMRVWWNNKMPRYIIIYKNDSHDDIYSHPVYYFDTNEGRYLLDLTVF